MTGRTEVVGRAVAASGSACPQHSASFVDADANMNCTKRRPEEAKSDVDIPAGSTPTVISSVTRTETAENGSKSFAKSDYVSQWRYPDLTVQLFIHVGCLYGFYLVFTSVKVLTLIWVFVVVYASGFGITAGAHRLWSHRAYRAKWPLRFLLIILFTVAGQRHVYQWALDHRVHHKYSETNADPHDARRGFLFSHIGWLVLTPHPEVEEKRKAIDMSDLEADPIVMWQKRLYVPLFAIFVIVIPVFVPWYYWDEGLWQSFWVLFNSRFCITLNMAFLVNSVAHMWGNRPYDKNISPTENFVVSMGALGEGWHNYHHVFPYDYKTAELGRYSLNPTTAFIDFFVWLGWAYNCKTVSEEMMKRRVHRSGDGSHRLWGWGDRDISEEDKCDLETSKDQ